MTALSGDALDREGVTDFEDLARRTGLTTIDRGPSQNDVALRGVASGVAPRSPISAAQGRCQPIP